MIEVRLGSTICRQLDRNVGSPICGYLTDHCQLSGIFLGGKNKGSQPIKTLILLLLPLLTSHSSVLAFFSPWIFLVQELHFWYDFGKKY